MAQFRLKLKVNLSFSKHIFITKHNNAMKKLLYNHKVVSTAFTSLCLAAMATSCSQELEESKVQTDNNPAALNVVKLNFATSALTRGTMYDDIAQMPDDATFGVYGYGHKDGEPTPNDANFINNGSAKKDGVVRVKGEVATYKTKMPKVQLAAVYPRLDDRDGDKLVRDGKDKYTLTYSLKKNMAQQKDLMIGQADEFEINDQNPTNENTNSGKTINMHHALTAINFAIGDRVPTGYTIERIYLRGLYTKGTCKVDLSKNNDAERFTWTPLGDKDKKENYVGIKLNKVSTTQINRTPFTGLKNTDGKYDNFTVFIIPQELTSDAVAEVYLKKEEHQDINIDHRVKAKKITIPLTSKEKDNTIKAGQERKYYLNCNIDQNDIKPLFEFVYKKKGQETRDSTKFDLRFVTPEKTTDGCTEYQITISSRQYSAGYKRDEPGGKIKNFVPIILAPHSFEIVGFKYTYKYNPDGTKTDEYNPDGTKTKTKKAKRHDMPLESVKVQEVEQPQQNDNKYGKFKLVFNPAKYPTIPNYKQKNKNKPQKLDKIYIYLKLKGNDTIIELPITNFPSTK